MAISRRARSRAPTKKAEQSAATRARLIDAARRLFGAHGYHAVSVTEIAREAGVTHGMINAHFNAKAGLLYALIQESNDQQKTEATSVAAAKGDVRARLRQVISVYAEGDLRDPELFAVMQSYYWEWPAETERENRAELSEAMQPVRTILEEGVAAGELRGDLEIEATIRAIYALYTFSMRPAVYDGASTAACVDGAMAQIGLLLRGSETR